MSHALFLEYVIPLRPLIAAADEARVCLWHFSHHDGRAGDPCYYSHGYGWFGHGQGYRGGSLIAVLKEPGLWRLRMPV